MGMCGFLAGDMRNGDVVGLDELVTIEESSNGGVLGRKDGVREDGEVRRYKSKNLVTERNRRQRLSERMLILRSLVPKITNMNKATIIVDAVSYIQELQEHVEQLTAQLQEMEAKAYLVDEESQYQEGESSLKKEITQNPIPLPFQAEVDLTPIDQAKLWMKLVFSNRRGGFTKIMEAMNYLGLEPTDISLTTSGGAVLISSCVEGIYGQVLEADSIRLLLQEVIMDL